MSLNYPLLKRKKNLKLTHHFYIHYKPGDINLLYGRYGMGSKQLLSAYQIVDLQIFKSEISELLQSSSRILVYIHGFMAHMGFYEKKTGYLLQKEIFDKTKERYPVVISLKWETQPDYGKSIKDSTQAGQQLGTALIEINDYLKQNGIYLHWSWLCHSMGCRIFTEMFKGMKAGYPRFENVILMAADIPYDVFEKELSELPFFTDRIYVFISNSDKTLEIANWLVPYVRLGRSGPRHKIASNAWILDVSEVNDHEGIIPRLSKHRYYYASAEIRDYLLRVLDSASFVNVSGKITEIR